MLAASAFQGATRLKTRQTVFIVDDDKSVAMALERVLRAEGYSTQVWTSATAFLADHDQQEPGCLVTDILMPEMTGLELRRELANSGCSRPVIFVTASSTLAAANESRADIIGVVMKPARRDDLLAAVREAMARDSASRLP